jgi:hypothetical protein
LSEAQRPQLVGMPEQGGISAEPDDSSEPVAAKTESFFSSLGEPQCEQWASPSQLEERTRSSESLSQSEQVNS